MATWGMVFMQRFPIFFSHVGQTVPKDICLPSWLVIPKQNLIKYRTEHKGCLKLEFMSPSKYFHKCAR